MPEPEFFFYAIIGGGFAAVCFIVGAILLAIGRRNHSQVLRGVAMLPIAFGAFILIPILLVGGAWAWFWIFGSSETPASTGAVGTFRGSGTGFIETITIGPGPGYEFRHTVERNGVVVCDETGKAEVTGREVRFPQFTKHIESQSGQPSAKPQKVYSYSVYYFGGRPEVLKPWPEHDYFLRK